MSPTPPLVMPGDPIHAYLAAKDAGQATDAMKDAALQKWRDGIIAWNGIKQLIDSPTLIGETADRALEIVNEQRRMTVDQARAVLAVSEGGR